MILVLYYVARAIGWIITVLAWLVLIAIACVITGSPIDSAPIGAHTGSESKSPLEHPPMLDLDSIAWLFSPARLLLLAADRRDAAIMRELADPALGRATLAPATLASIGLDHAEFKAIALGLPLPSDTIVTEHRLDQFEHIVLETTEPEFCQHGYALTDEETWPHACEECAADIGEACALPAESWAGGFADNH